jgi:hypothetical protein
LHGPRRWVVASLAALTLAGGTFASANFLPVLFPWVPLVGVSHPPPPPPQCLVTTSVSTAFDPNAPSDPNGTPGNGNVIVTAVHAVVSSPAGAATNPCVGHTLDVVLTGVGGPPYPYPDALMLPPGGQVIPATGMVDWTIPPGTFLLAANLTGVIHWIT